MSLLKCPKCGKEINDTATTCPHCECLINKISVEAVGVNKNPVPPPTKSKIRKLVVCGIVCIFILLCIAFVLLLTP